MGQEPPLPEDYNTEFNPAAFLQEPKEQAAAENDEGDSDDESDNSDDA